MQIPEEDEDPAPLVASDPPRDPAAVELIDAVIECERAVAAAMGARAVAIDRAWRWAERTAQTGRSLPFDPASGRRPADFRWDAGEAARRSMLAELACALRLPEATMGRLLFQSQMLVHELCATQAALAAGLISYRHARAVIEHAASLPALARAGFETRVLPEADALTVAQFERKARKIREHSHPDSIQARNRKCLLDRTVYFQPARDGMGTLVISTAAGDGQAIFNRLTGLAATLQGDGETRTLTQLRADVAADLLLDGITTTGLGEGVRATVNVTVPVLTLLGLSEQPGDLTGYGPIDPDTARRLAGTATGFTRLLTHPATGTVLSVDNTPYRVPKELKRWLEVRDQTCRFVGCSRPVRRCDLDHTTAKNAGGCTCAENLAHLCPPHHALKHETDWAVAQTPDGVLHWTSPAGKHYATDPATRIHPETPDEAAKRRKHTLPPPRPPALNRPPTPNPDEPPPF